MLKTEQIPSYMTLFLKIKCLRSIKAYCSYNSNKKLNHQEGNLNVSVLIKSGYYIVFNPSKAIVFMYQIHFISISGPELEEQKLLILRKEIQLHVCLSGLTHEADQLKLQRCLRSQLKSSAEAAIILEQSRALQVNLKPNYFKKQHSSSSFFLT